MVTQDTTVPAWAMTLKNPDAACVTYLGLRTTRH